MEKFKRIRPRNWLYESFVVIEVLIIITICCLLIKPLLYGLIVGSWLYLVLANVLRGIFLKHHKRGIKQMGNRHFTEAIDAFSLSHDFFEKHKGIDKYRFLTMFMSSKLSYRQMALFNLANCYAAKSQFNEAKEKLEQFLQTAPPDEATQEALAIVTKIDDELKN